MRGAGVEPAPEAWKASVLPLDYPRAPSAKKSRRRQRSPGLKGRPRRCAVNAGGVPLEKPRSPPTRDGGIVNRRRPNRSCSRRTRRRLPSCSPRPPRPLCASNTAGGISVRRGEVAETTTRGSAEPSRPAERLDRLIRREGPEACADHRAQAGFADRDEPEGENREAQN